MKIGPDTTTFTHALRAALRQDPDVILVGEMRDAETIEVAIKAAETGPLGALDRSHHRLLSNDQSNHRCLPP